MPLGPEIHFTFRIHRADPLPEVLEKTDLVMGCTIDLTRVCFHIPQ